MTRENALLKIRELQDNINQLQEYIENDNKFTIEMVDMSLHFDYDLHVGKYPVTQAQWKQVMGNNPSYFKGDNLPVELVSWNDCQQFLEKLNDKTGKKFRLLTDYEWLICSGNHQEINGDIGWYRENSNGATQKVGQKQPNIFGLYDMLGNVWEWTDSKLGTYRVIRGGSWSNEPADCRSAYRGRWDPGRRYGSLGFRLALIK